MEDILASIRRILAEDGGVSASEPEVARAAPKRVPLDDEDHAEEAAERRGPGISAPAPSPEAEEEQAFGTPQVEEDFAPAAVAASAPAGTARSPDPLERLARPAELDEDDVFVLSPEMRAAGHKLVSEETAADSTDVLSKLARAILERRDIAIGSRDLTLEGLVREMLRPLLREWLDRNLPYLIERLVRKEIDLMINRAERLED